MLQIGPLPGIPPLRYKVHFIFGRFSSVIPSWWTPANSISIEARSLQLEPARPGTDGVEPQPHAEQSVQAMVRSKTLTRGEDITHAILVLRGQRVILARDLAEIYGVTTKRLNEQVKRNAERFPEDFMFQLTPAETELSRSQFATLKARSRPEHQVPPVRLH